MVWNYQNADYCLKVHLLCSLGYYNFRHTFVPYRLLLYPGLGFSLAKKVLLTSLPIDEANWLKSLQRWTPLVGITCGLMRRHSISHDMQNVPVALFTKELFVLYFCCKHFDVECVFHEKYAILLKIFYRIHNGIVKGNRDRKKNGLASLSFHRILSTWTRPTNSWKWSSDSLHERIK